MFLEFCARPEFADMRYDKVQSIGTLNCENKTQLPILDSVIKVSVELNSLDKSKQSICLSGKKNLH